MTASLSLAESRLNGSASTNTLPTIQPIQVRDRVHPEAHMLFWQYRGAATIIASGKPIGLCAKQALWLPAGVHHDIEVDADSVLLRIFFGAKHLAIAPEMASPHIFHVDQELMRQSHGLGSKWRFFTSIKPRAGPICSGSAQHAASHLAVARESCGQRDCTDA